MRIFNKLSSRGKQRKVSQHLPHGPMDGRVVRHLRRTLIAGALLVVPVAITYLVLRIVFDAIDGLVQPAVERFWGRTVPGLGILAEIVLIYLAGLFFANVLGRRMVKGVQGAILRVPLIGFIYGASRQLIESFSGTGQTGFKRVVMVEYPRPGAWAIGFLTAITLGEGGRQLGVVYIPTAPAPSTGWVAILPLEDVYDTDLTVQQAIQFVLSGGIVSPERIATRRIKPSEMAAGPGVSR